MLFFLIFLDMPIDWWLPELMISISFLFRFSFLLLLDDHQDWIKIKRAWKRFANRFNDRWTKQDEEKEIRHKNKKKQRNFIFETNSFLVIWSIPIHQGDFLQARTRLKIVVYLTFRRREILLALDIYLYIQPISISLPLYVDRPPRVSTNEVIA